MITSSERPKCSGCGVAKCVDISPTAREMAPNKTKNTNREPFDVYVPIALCSAKQPDQSETFVKFLQLAGAGEQAELYQNSLKTEQVSEAIVENRL